MYTVVEMVVMVMTLGLLATNTNLRLKSESESELKAVECSINGFVRWQLLLNNYSLNKPTHTQQRFLRYSSDFVTDCGSGGRFTDLWRFPLRCTTQFLFLAQSVSRKTRFCTRKNKLSSRFSSFTNRQKTYVKYNNPTIWWNLKLPRLSTVGRWTLKVSTNSSTNGLLSRVCF